MRARACGFNSEPTVMKYFDELMRSMNFLAQDPHAGAGVRVQF
jgi:hypothetical protein